MTCSDICKEIRARRLDRRYSKKRRSNPPKIVRYVESKASIAARAENRKFNEMMAMFPRTGGVADPADPLRSDKGMGRPEIVVRTLFRW